MSWKFDTPKPGSRPVSEPVTLTDIRIVEVNVRTPVLNALRAEATIVWATGLLDPDFVATSRESVDLDEKETQEFLDTMLTGRVTTKAAIEEGAYAILLAKGLIDPGVQT